MSISLNSWINIKKQELEAAAKPAPASKEKFHTGVSVKSLKIAFEKVEEQRPQPQPLLKIIKKNLKPALQERLSLREWEDLFNRLVNTDEYEGNELENVFNLLENTERYEDDFFINNTDLFALIKSDSNLIRTAWKYGRDKLLRVLKIDSVPTAWKFKNYLERKPAITYKIRQGIKG